MAPISRLAGVAGLAVLLLAPGGPAAAHTSLDEARPADGSRVDEALRWVNLRFTGPVAAAGAAVAVTDADGTRVDVGEPRVRGPRLRQRVRPVRRGQHAVRFRVFSTDGHSLDGRLSFSYAGPVPARPRAGGRPAQATEAAAAADPSATADAEAAAPTPGARRDAEPAPSAPTVPGPALALAGVLLVGATAAVALRRRRPSGPPPRTG